MAVLAGAVLVPASASANTVAVGPAHTLVVTDRGVLFAFGDNRWGQAGQDSSKSEVRVPALVEGLSDIVAVAAGAEHSLALDSHGHVFAFGSNAYGQLGVEGLEGSTKPVEVPGVGDVVAIAAGDFHSVALTRTGDVYCWGRGAEGQLDNGSTENRPTPTLIRGISGAIGIGAGGAHTVAVLGPLNGGAVVVWGRNRDGQAGDGTQSSASNPVAADSLRGMLQGVAGSDFTLALGGDGRVRSWGSNAWHQLARDDDRAFDPTVGLVPALGEVRLLFAGGVHALALTTGGGLLEWGAGGDVTPVAGVENAIAAATGGGVSIEGASFGHSVAVTARGEVVAWGSNDRGQLGDGTTRAHAAATRIAEAGFQWTGKAVPPVPRAAHPGAGAGQPRAARPGHGDVVDSVVADPVLSLSSGTYAAGTPVTLTCSTPGAEIHYTLNGVDPGPSDLFISSGQTLIVGNYTLKARGFLTGYTASGTVSATYTVTGSFTPGMAVVGSSFSLYLASDGTVWSTLVSHPIVDRVPGLTGIVSIAAGYDFAYALGSDHTLWNVASTPTKVALSNVVAIAAGNILSSVAVTSDGKAYGWGSNGAGQLGMGNNSSVPVPTQIPGVSGAVAVAAGNQHSLILKADGTVVSAGRNLSGQLGVGDTTDRWSFTPALDMTEITAISAGCAGSFSLALRSDGAVFGFGDNGQGQLGDGTLTSRYAPQLIPAFTGTAKIAAGSNHSLAISATGGYWVWGNSGYGQLGDGGTALKTTPELLTSIANGLAVGGGDHSSVAITSDGSVFAWGANTNGLLGDGTSITRLVPTRISDPGFHWKAGTPTFSVAAGTYPATQSVAISCAHGGATIRYTTDGSEPTSTHGSVYTTGVPVPITVSTTLKAKAFRADLGDSNTATAVYELKPATPVFNPTGGVKTAPVNVAITSSPGAATIRYTLDGSDPAGGTVYTTAVPIAHTSTLKAQAFMSDWTPSTVTTATYTMNLGTAAAPTMSPTPPATGVSPVNVTLSTTTADATIRYNVAASNPANPTSTTGTVYTTTPIVLTSNMTVKAAAFHPDYQGSTVTTGVYTVQLVPPTLTPGTGSYTLGQAVTVSHPDPTVTLRYTIDGADPTAADPVIAVGAVLRPVATHTLRVKAFKSTNADSAATSATYTMSGSIATGAASAGDAFGAAIRPGGSLWGWGLNTSGQIGQGNVTSPVKTPTQVSGTTSPIAVSAGFAHVLVLGSGGTAWSYGSNLKGEAGDLTCCTNKTSSVQVLATAGTPLSGLVAVSAGKNFSVVLDSSQFVWAFGQNTYGQLGQTAGSGNYPTPTKITGLSGVTAIAAGGEHTIVLKSDGSVWALGHNDKGQLGNGSVDSSTPLQVKSPDGSNLMGAVAIAAGYYHNLALKSDGTVVAWGYNASGQLGIGNTTTPIRAATLVVNLTGVYSITGGTSHSQASTKDGSLFTWGTNNNDQMGVGTAVQSSTKAMWVPGPSGVVASDGGGLHGIARTFDNILWGWGTNSSYQVGDGSGVTQDPPVPIATATQWQVATPVLSPLGGDKTAITTVTVTSATPGATFYYTLDGTVPTTSSATVPGGGVVVDHTLTLKVKGVKSGLADSNVPSEFYNMKLLLPTFTPGTGSYGTPQTVSITEVPAAEIHYTLVAGTPNASSPLYTTPLALDGNMAIRAIAYKTGWTDSQVALGTFTFNVAAPALAPGGGTYTSPQTVTATTTTPGATLHYTTTGVEPTESDPFVTSGGTIAVSQSETLMVEGFKTGWNPSTNAVAQYTLNLGGLATPTFSPPAGTYSAALDVTISTATSGAILRYTTDGNDPTFTSPPYLGPVRVDWTMTLKARAFRSDTAPSAVATAAYTVNLANTVAPPAMSPPPGSYLTKQTVTLSSATSGSTISYTTDGTLPVVGTSPSVATGGTITLTANAIVRAVASLAGMTASPIRRGDYQITGAVQAGYNHALVLKTDGTVWGWGVNTTGQLGTGSTSTVTTPTQAGTLTQVVGISSAGDSSGGTSLAVDALGNVKGWGKNDKGQTGIGSSTPTNVLTPTVAPGLSGIVAVSAGYDHGLALKSDSTVWAWGSNVYGQLGNNGSGGTNTTPAKVQTGPSTYLTDAIAIAAGRFFSVALKRDGTVVAWGTNIQGSVGDGTNTQRNVATPVSGLSGVIAISAGLSHAWGLKTDGQATGCAWGWGNNDSSALGMNVGMTNVPLRLFCDVVATGTGWNNSLFVRSQAGSVPAIWGTGVISAGEISGYLGSQVTTPFQLVTGDFVAVDGDSYVNLGLRRDGSLFLWGSASAHYGDGFTLGTAGAGGQDTDNDGLTTDQEWAIGTDPLNPDTNGDGLSDGVEFQSGLSPTNLDMDGDGVLNPAELVKGTDPFRADTDGDGVNDGADCYPLDPTRSTCPPSDPNDHTPPTITLTEPTNAVLISSVP